MYRGNICRILSGDFSIRSPSLSTHFFHLCVRRCLLSTAVSELFVHAVFQLVRVRQAASSECILQVAQEMKVGGC
jgi:hypothetical protein